MKSLKKGFDAHGNEHKTHKPSKHDANLRKTGTLYFQIGLLISSVLVFLVFQINFTITETVVGIDTGLIIDDDPYVVTDYVKYVKPVAKTEVVKNPIKKSSNFKVVDDDTDIKKAEKKIFSQDGPEPDTNLDFGKIEYKGPDVVIGPVDFKKVEFVPIFPGCESLDTNNERKICMSEKIDKIVRRNFRTDMAVDYGLTGKQKIFVQFKINKQGLVSDVKVRAPHKVLEDEAKRVTKLIPQMKPGRQRNQDVEVVFLKPIVFMVQ